MSTPTWRTRLASRATVTAFRLAWRFVRLLPPAVAYRSFDVVADLTTRRDTQDVRRLRANYARVRPDLGPAALQAEVRAGVREYLRYWCDAFRLPDIEPDVLADTVRTVGDAPVRAALARGDGVVMFLGHLGSWDLAGAWSTTNLAPVTTVAERLEPEDLFTEFVSFRERLGMTVLPLTGGGPVFDRLAAVLRAGGFVPLLADRDLTGTGLVVRLCGHDARVAAGPAALALAAGARLFPVSVAYERRHRPGGTGSGFDLRITWHDEVQASDVATMTQACADALGRAVAADPRQWHMMQRVFTADLDDRPGDPPRPAADGLAPRPTGREG